MELVKQFFQFFIGGIISASNGAKKVASDFAEQTQQLGYFAEGQQALQAQSETELYNALEAERKMKILIAYAINVVMIIIAVVIVYFFMIKTAKK